ncbi:MAG: iron ABC transporter permease [Aridibacter famidurans]|nr:iron ABC transporter permease [Aridibacter famidurans]
MYETARIRTIVNRSGSATRRRLGSFAPARLLAIPFRKPAIAILAAVLAAVVILAVGVGAVQISVPQIIAIIASKAGITLPFAYEAQQESVLMAIRLPRVLLGLFVGAGLAVSGALLQGLFRNPLADPGLLGVSSGAAFFAVLAIVLGDSVSSGAFAGYSHFGLPFAAFAGGSLTIACVYLIAKRHGSLDTATILLAGIAINALASAGIGLLIFAADDAQLRTITFWNLGSLAGATWQSLLVVVPLMVLPLLFLRNIGRQLNALMLGDAEAEHLGIDTERLKRRMILVVGLVVGAGVSITGMIGFVGLVAPHLVRLTLGADHRTLLPASAILGAVLIIGADLVGRTAVAPAELPIGVITAAVGAPFFLWMLLRKR